MESLKNKSPTPRNREQESAGARGVGEERDCSKGRSFQLYKPSSGGLMYSMVTIVNNTALKCVSTP